MKRLLKLLIPVLMTQEEYESRDMRRPKDGDMPAWLFVAIVLAIWMTVAALTGDIPK